MSTSLQFKRISSIMPMPATGQEWEAYCRKKILESGFQWENMGQLSVMLTGCDWAYPDLFSATSAL
jgi:hypothetical protein